MSNDPVKIGYKCVKSANSKQSLQKPISPIPIVIQLTQINKQKERKTIN